MGKQNIEIDENVQRRAFIQLAKAKKKMIDNMKVKFSHIVFSDSNETDGDKYIKMNYDMLLEEYRAIMQIVNWLNKHNRDKQP